MKVAKTKLIFTNGDKLRQVVNAGTEITKALGIPADTMKRFESRGVIGDKESEQKQVVEPVKEESKKDNSSEGLDPSASSKKKDK